MAIGTQIPSQIVQQIILLLSKQIDAISNLAEKTSTDCLNLAHNVKCSDPTVKQIKGQLADLQRLIDQLNIIINRTSDIISIINTVATTASVLKIIQLAIPSVPGVPTGPITELINIFTKLIDNAKSSINSLKGILANIKSQFNRINSLIANSINTIGSICNNESFTVTSEVASIINNASSIIGNDTSIINDQYPTEFYTNINVSDDDINLRFNTISELLENQLDVMTNLVEAPSKVYQASGVPENNLGKLGDYYINLDNQSIYGPKAQANDWGQPVN
jgi:phage-related protein